ncbi:MAG: DUF4230 domain-containing protein [Lewinellaceae bacterium]|nr:DUF4230 domain-containing protein [Phaeodactylibacter sp.]MCB9039992.1 DUF4230 domain-containing protein [Lewinellaceae bacterium]
MMKRILAIIGLLAVFGLGFWAASWYFRQKAEDEIRSQSTVLLEKVSKVRKLVTVEGNFSELYDETNIRKFTLYVPMPSTWSFSKQAILKVTGKVLVGYDMEQIRISVDSLQHRIVVGNLPEPRILSIDHEVEYKNLEESFFNSFTPEDYTRINKNAKAVLRQKAEESRLLDEARKEGNQMLDVMRFMAESVGWELVVERNGLEVSVDSLLKN